MQSSPIRGGDRGCREFREFRELVLFFRDIWEMSLFPENIPGKTGMEKFSQGTGNACFNFRESRELMYIYIFYYL